MTEELIKIFERDLDRLRKEVEAFQDETNLWKTTGSVSNTAGNLCLHLIGNLNTFIGKNMGEIAYVRDRHAEFNLKEVPGNVLMENVDDTKNRVLSTLKKLGTEQLAALHPENPLGYEMTNGFFLIHLAAHLAYHLGQINYLRRVLE